MSFCSHHRKWKIGQMYRLTLNTEQSKERNKNANLAFREASHEGAAGSLVAAGISLVRSVRPIFTLTLTAEGKISMFTYPITQTSYICATFQSVIGLNCYFIFGVCLGCFKQLNSYCLFLKKQLQPFSLTSNKIPVYLLHHSTLIKDK